MAGSEPPQHNSSTGTARRREQPPAERGLLIAVAFWLCLMTSAALFASVVLAPRLVECHDLQLANLERQRQNIELEQHVAHVEKVVHALEYDTDFQDEVLQQDLGGSTRIELNTGEDIPVEGDLAFDMSVPTSSAPEVPLMIPWYVPILRTLSTPSDWRRRVLWMSAGFCVLAFVGLRERGDGKVENEAKSPSP